MFSSFVPHTYMNGPAKAIISECDSWKQSHKLIGFMYRYTSNALSSTQNWEEDVRGKESEDNPD